MLNTEIFLKKVNRMYKNHWRRNKQGYSKLKQQVKSVLESFKTQIDR